MSKSLRSMSTVERRKAIARRLASGTKGLGYWAAVDAQRKEQQVQQRVEVEKENKE